MKNTLKLFAAAAAEMVRTRKARVLFQGAFVGAFMAGSSELMGKHPTLSTAISWGVGTAIGQAIWETGTIYNRMKREQKFSSLNNG